MSASSTPTGVSARPHSRKRCMARLIKHRTIVDDAWLTLADDAQVPESGDIIVSLDRFKRERDSLLARSGGKLGVRLRSDQPVEDLGAEAQHLSVIALEFPVFRDG